MLIPSTGCVWSDDLFDTKRRQYSCSATATESILGRCSGIRFPLPVDTTPCLITAPPVTGGLCGDVLWDEYGAVDVSAPYISHDNVILRYDTHVSGITNPWPIVPCQGAALQMLLADAPSPPPSPVGGTFLFVATAHILPEVMHAEGRLSWHEVAFVRARRLGFGKLTVDGRRGCWCLEY